MDMDLFFVFHGGKQFLPEIEGVVFSLVECQTGIGLQILQGQNGFADQRVLLADKYMGSGYKQFPEDQIVLAQ